MPLTTFHCKIFNPTLKLLTALVAENTFAIVPEPCVIDQKPPAAAVAFKFATGLLIQSV